jgi:hypothetical protein
MAPGSADGGSSDQFRFFFSVDFFSGVTLPFSKINKILLLHSVKKNVYS